MQKYSEEGGDELCSYCKDTHLIIMYRNFLRMNLDVKPIRMSQDQCDRTYLNMYDHQSERAAAGKHVCVLRRLRFRADEGSNKWVDDIKN